MIVLVLCGFCVLFFPFPFVGGVFWTFGAQLLFGHEFGLYRIGEIVVTSKVTESLSVGIV